LMRLLVQYGPQRAHVVFKDENGDPVAMDHRVADLIITELKEEAFNFDREVFNQIMTLIEAINLDAEELTTFEDLLIKNEDTQIQEAVINLITSPHRMSERWVEFNEYSKHESDNLYHKVIQTMNTLKISRVMRFIHDRKETLKAGTEEEITTALEEIKIWEEVRRQISNLLGRVIVK
jgi:hypothetical protein